MRYRVIMSASLQGGGWYGSIRAFLRKNKTQKRICPLADARCSIQTCGTYVIGYGKNPSFSVSVTIVAKPALYAGYSQLFRSVICF
jgi:hypothetical protein